ncbi:MAG: hypothetical protein M3Q08_10240 [Pseudomonadota bacterium]|nr:hypothetical protein [Pseudomonadota bacterium]
MATLNYEDMKNLAALFEGWGLDTTRLTDEQRMKVLLWSEDYDELADFCGSTWRATAPEEPPDPIAFLARQVRKLSVRATDEESEK